MQAPSPPPDPPALWIIAGANGSGKSTAYERATIEAPSGGIWFINPDALAARIVAHEKLPLNPEANLEAVRRIERWLYASVDAHQTIGVETVLATGKYRSLVDRAHEQGFRVRLIYVLLENGDLNVARVRDRVFKGGHDVPEQSIRSRRTRSFGQLSWFFDHADQADILDNSGAEPRLVVRKAQDEVTIYGGLIAELAGALEVAVPGLTEFLKEQGRAKLAAAPGQGPGKKRRRRRRRRRRPRGAGASPPASSA
ncbi:MAG TPA: AAA family ATPase [Caulobacteraceae bacterium]